MRRLCMKADLLQVVGILLFAVAGWRASAQGCPRDPSSLTLQLYPGLTIAGQIGYTNRVEYTTDPSVTNSWTPLTNFVLSSTPFFFVDLTSPARRLGNDRQSPYGFRIVLSCR